MTRQEALQLLNECIDELFRNDLILLRNDVSERAITHKLAEYLQARVPKLNVDCEYNRNAEAGTFAPKYLNLIESRRKEVIGKIRVDQVPEEDLRACSTFPDIIIHHRGTNDANTLIIEAKKKNSTVADEFDFAKLRGFTGDNDGNEYSYEHGVFIEFETAVDKPSRPKLTWFSKGREDAAD